MVLERPDAKERRPYWRARFRSPETGKVAKVRLDPLALSTAEARREWAILKAKELARDRMERDLGERTKAVRLPVASVVGKHIGVVDEFFARAENRLQARTVELYQAAAKLFLEWAAAEGIETSDQVKATTLP